MKKSKKILALVMALVMIATAVPMMTASADAEHTHEYVLQDGATEATCTEDGVATYKCACGDVKVATTKALDHKLIGTYVVEDDVHYKYCDRCKKQVRYEHDYRFEVKNDERNKPATCTEVGKQVYRCTCNKTIVKDVEVIAHTYENAIADGDNHVGKCTVCNKTITEAHTWDEGVETKAVMCHADGEMTYTCTGCGATKKEVIKAGHDVAELAVSINDKEHKYECSRDKCGYATTEAHSLVVVMKMNKKPDMVEATCESTGSIKVKCEGCDYEDTLIIAKAKHTFGDFEKYDADKHAQKCEVCKVEAYANHTWDEGKVTKEPTHEEEGTQVYTGTACKETKTETIAKLQFVLGDVNKDGDITAVDARIILQNVAGLREFTDEEKELADINKDGNITAVDARIILQIVAGLREA